MIVLPNEYTGTFKIVEGENPDPYEPRAKEEYDVYDYSLGDDDLLVVDDLDIIRNASELNFAYEWVEPVTPGKIVYGKDEISVTIE